VKIAVFVFVIHARSLLFSLYRRSCAAGASRDRLDVESYT